MAGLINNQQYALYFQKVGLLYKRPEIKASLEIVLSVFTVAFLIIVAIRPTLVNITSLQKKITDLEIVNKKADNKIAQLLNAQKQLNTYSSSLVLFDQAVPDTFSYKDSAKRLEYVALANSVKIETLGFDGYSLLEGGKVSGDWVARLAKPDTNNILSDSITYSVSGKPQNVLTFLSEIEKMDRLVRLDSVSLTKQLGLSQGDSSLNASGQMTFYFYSAKK